MIILNIEATIAKLMQENKKFFNGNDQTYSATEDYTLMANNLVSLLRREDY